jgi:hypothetical protein
VICSIRMTSPQGSLRARVIDEPRSLFAKSDLSDRISAALAGVLQTFLDKMSRNADGRPHGERDPGGGLFLIFFRRLRGGQLAHPVLGLDPDVSRDVVMTPVYGYTRKIWTIASTPHPLTQIDNPERASPFARLGEIFLSGCISSALRSGPA